MSKTSEKPRKCPKTGKTPTKMSQSYQNTENCPKNKKIPTKKSQNKKETVKKNPKMSKNH